MSDSEQDSDVEFDSKSWKLETCCFFNCFALVEEEEVDEEEEEEEEEEDEESSVHESNQFHRVSVDFLFFFCFFLFFLFFLL
jgi:hypothetical protein